MGKYIVAFGISKKGNEFLLLKSPLSLVYGALEDFPGISLYNYICQFAKPDIFVLLNGDVIIYNEKGGINKVIKYVKFPKLVSRLKHEKYIIYKYEIENTTFYSFDYVSGRSLKEALKIIGVNEKLAENIVEELEEGSIIGGDEFEDERYRIFVAEYPNCLILKDKQIDFGFIKNKIFVVEK